MRILAFLLVIFSCASLTNASPCSNYDRDRAHHFAEIAGEKIVHEYGGGRNIRVSLYDCDNNTYSNEFRLKIGISWNGSINASNYYSSEGLLKLRNDGSKSSYSESYANQKLKDWKTTRLWLGGAIVLGALAAEANDKGFYVNNKCKYDARFFVRYKNISGDWVNSGWYNFTSRNKRIRLLSKDKPIQTNNSYVYIFVEDPKGNPRITGTHSVNFGGQNYRAFEFKAKSFPVDMVLCG